jgi:hypothetical protein
MKVVEEYRESINSFEHEPIRYRASISIEPHNKRILLLRELFRVGFLRGEENDKFYIDNEYQQKDTLYRCSFITQNMDKKYHKEMEIKLMNIFYDGCGKSIKILEKKLKDETKNIKYHINMYNDLLNTFEYVKRGDKLKKLKNKLK